MKYLALLLFVPLFGTAQNLKFVDNDYPDVLMKSIENDTVTAKLVTSKAIVDGYVVYRQAKRLHDNHIFRFPESFLTTDKKVLKEVLYYEADRIIDYYPSYQLESITPADIQYDGILNLDGIKIIEN